MEFSEVGSVITPEGDVEKIVAPDGVLWESDSGGGGGGNTGTAYTGSTTASGLTYLRCIPGELDGASDPDENLGQGTKFDCNIENITATLNEAREDANVVSKIQNGVVTYYDVTLAEYVTTTFELVPYQHPGTGYIQGIELRVTTEAEDSSAVLFDGTYTWSFTETAK